MARWTAGIAIALGAVAALTALEPLPVAPSDATHVSAGQALRNESSRAPASAPEDTTLQLTVDCRPRTDVRVESAVLNLRVSGPLCARVPAGAAPTAKIINETNGYSATAFFLAPRTFTTDYIPLAPGENQIAIEFAWHDGRVEHRSIAVLRAK